MDLRTKSVKIYRSRVHNLMDFAVSDNGEVPVCINVSFIAILATLALRCVKTFGLALIILNGQTSEIYPHSLQCNSVRIIS